jgi:hypothetical protein
VKIALVSEGPSAAEFPGPAGYTRVIGVNSVPTRWPCSWWVFADPEFYVCDGPSVIGRPQILTTSSLERAMNERRFQAAGLEERYRRDRTDQRIRVEEEMPLMPAMPRGVPILEAGPRKGQARWFNYSGLGGLACAWFLASGTLDHLATRANEPVQIDVFGVDLVGIGDVNGKQAPCRTEGRWERERRIWNGMKEGMERTGRVTIRWTPMEKRHGNAE